MRMLFLLFSSISLLCMWIYAYRKAALAIYFQSVTIVLRFRCTKGKSIWLYETQLERMTNATPLSGLFVVSIPSVLLCEFLITNWILEVTLDWYGCLLCARSTNVNFSRYIQLWCTSSEKENFLGKQQIINLKRLAWILIKELLKRRLTFF